MYFLRQKLIISVINYASWSICDLQKIGYKHNSRAGDLKKLNFM